MDSTGNVGQLQELEVSRSAKMAEFEDRLKSALVPSNPTLLQLSQDFYAFKVLVSNMFDLLQQQVRRCFHAVDEMETLHRRKILLFKGTDDHESNVEQKVVDLIHNKLGLTHISNSSFKHCHCLGAHDSGRSRAVLVSIKKEVLKSKTKLKSSPFTICEFLTKMRQSVHATARKHFGLKNVWTLDGKIYVKLPDGNLKKIANE